MRYARILALGVAISILSGLCAFAAATEAIDWPTRWQVNGNGMTGTLEFSVDGEGALSGRLLDEQVEGFLSGRHLFIRRSSAGQVEVWEGWLARPRQDGDVENADSRGLIVAGSITVGAGGQTRVYPWFGTTETAPAAASSVSPGKPVAPVAAATPTTKTANAAEVPSGADSRSSSGDTLSGTWSAEDDTRMAIDQQGNRLTVTLADGSSHAGRMTGATTLVVGLRKGCCNGTVEAPDVIVWSDGARWERAD